MQVHEGMSRHGPDGRPGHSLRAVARLMSERRVGAAVVMDPDGHRPADHHRARLLVSIRGRSGPDRRDCLRTPDARRCLRRLDWSLEEAAAAMVQGGFRHLIVLDGGETGRDPSRSATSFVAGLRRRDLSGASRVAVG